MKLDLPTINKNRVNKKLFLDKDFCLGDTSIDIDANYNIILSPSLYWVREEQIPVRFSYQAHKLLPLLFEDTLPEGEYAYALSKKAKEGSEYYIFAYDSQKITQLLKNHNIDIGRCSLYFAQNELTQYERVAIGEHSYIDTINGIAVVVPLTCEEGCENIATLLNKVVLSDERVTINTFDKRLSLQTTIKITAVLSLFIVGFFIEAIYYSNYTSTLDEKREKLIENWGIPTTSIQQNSIIKRLKKLNSEQMKIRDVVTKIKNENLTAFNTKIKKVTYQKKRFVITLDKIEQNKSVNIEGLQKEFAPYSVTDINNQIVIRGDI